MSLTDPLGVRLLDELQAEYRPVLTAVLRLEREFPVVAKNQVALSQNDVHVVGNTQANLFYAMQGTVPKERQKSRREIREALVALQHIPGIRPGLIAVLLEAFSGTIYMVEHLFFLNREIARRITELPREPLFDGYTVETAVYPMERVDAIVDLAYRIWKEQYVLQNAAE
jgi:hypothetical protein